MIRHPDKIWQESSLTQEVIQPGQNNMALFPWGITESFVRYIFFGVLKYFWGIKKCIGEQKIFFRGVKSP